MEKYESAKSVIQNAMDNANDYDCVIRLIKLIDTLISGNNDSML